MAAAAAAPMPQRPRACLAHARLRGTDAPASRAATRGAALACCSSSPPRGAEGGWGGRGALAGRWAGSTGAMTVMTHTGPPLPAATLTLCTGQADSHAPHMQQRSHFTATSHAPHMQQRSHFTATSHAPHMQQRSHFTPTSHAAMHPISHDTTSGLTLERLRLLRLWHSAPAGLLHMQQRSKTAVRTLK